MYGEFFGNLSLKKLKAFFPIDKIVCDVTANGNIGPSQEIFAIIRYKSENRLDKFHWGLVPFWAKDISIGNRMINARAESIAEKPAFREAFKYRRCLIPAAGFYEWIGQVGKKQPVFITLPDRKPFAFAGLWETWENKNDANSIYKSCTIITTRASETFRAVHHRMPAILKSRAYDTWLDPGNHNAAALGEILNSDLISELANFAVSKRANAPHPGDSTAKEAIGKPRQTMFDWPEPSISSPEDG
jgi:putative SOS response-associated peptidase YedK